mmetsp:Transcript_67172/g.196405  ORF Transcript_67172/g.196405 Transcript_67172/m.196405 type:complete len:240 (-) Transcript_67172:293-1012(-)
MLSGVRPVRRQDRAEPVRPGLRRGPLGAPLAVRVHQDRLEDEDAAAAFRASINHQSVFPRQPSWPRPVRDGQPVERIDQRRRGGDRRERLEPREEPGVDVPVRGLGPLALAEGGAASASPIWMRSAEHEEVTTLWSASGQAVALLYGTDVAKVESLLPTLEGLQLDARLVLSWRRPCRLCSRCWLLGAWRSSYSWRLALCCWLGCRCRDGSLCRCRDGGLCSDGSLWLGCHCSGSLYGC